MFLSGEHHSISNPELWQAIKNVPLPDVVTPKDWSRPSKTETFQERLSSKHELTEESARRLVEEYRRFIYLKAIDGGTLTPSERVDQAWHLHMETAGEGWARFCDEVLECQIDHQTGLSQSEAKKSYARLLDLYRREFNHEPPIDIWPGEREKKKGTIAGWLALTGAVFLVGGFLFAAYVGDAGTMLGVAVGIGLLILAERFSKGIDLETVAKCG